MKKLNLFYGLLIGLLILSSCSSDDNNEVEIDANPLLGTWKPIKEVYGCAIASNENFEYDDCEQQAQYVFTSDSKTNSATDGTITITEKELVNGVCQTEGIINGIWNLDGDKLTITTNDETYTPSFFELTPNRLRIGDYYPEAPCDGETGPSYFYFEFIKI